MEPVLVHRTRGVRRAAWAFLALVQFATLVSVPLADAALDAESERVAHVESESDPSCAIHHDHLFCQLCRTLDLRAHATASPASTLQGGAIHSNDERIVEVVRFVLREPFSPVGSRAPPA